MTCEDAARLVRLVPAKMSRGERVGLICHLLECDPCQTALRKRAKEAIATGKAPEGLGLQEAALLFRDLQDSEARQLIDASRARGWLNHAES